MDAKKKVKTTVSFQPSPDVLAAVSSGDVGKACHKAKLFIKGESGETVTIPPGESHLVIESEVGITIGLYLSAFNREGVQSQAVPFEFFVTDQCPSKRPQQLHITRVEVSGECGTSCGCEVPKMPEANVTDEGLCYNITVNGHNEIKDGAVGVILGIDPQAPDRVHAMFPMEALRPGVTGERSGKEYVFAKDTPFAVTVISPAQTTGTLAQYIDSILREVAF